MCNFDFRKLAGSNMKGFPNVLEKAEVAEMMENNNNRRGS
jgi:hypothetical protein